MHNIFYIVWNRALSLFEFCPRNVVYFINPGFQIAETVPVLVSDPVREACPWSGYDSVFFSHSSYSRKEIRTYRTVKR